MVESFKMSLQITTSLKHFANTFLIYQIICRILDSFLACFHQNIFFLKSSTFYCANVLLFIYIFCICYFICLHLSRYNEQSTLTDYLFGLFLGAFCLKTQTTCGQEYVKKLLHTQIVKSCTILVEGQFGTTGTKKTCGRERGLQSQMRKCPT